jgi:hypothetical protein
MARISPGWELALTEVVVLFTPAASWLPFETAEKLTVEHVVAVYVPASANAVAGGAESVLIIWDSAAAGVVPTNPWIWKRVPAGVKRSR